MAITSAIFPGAMEPRLSPRPRAMAALSVAARRTCSGGIPAEASKANSS